MESLVDYTVFKSSLELLGVPTNPVTKKGTFVPPLFPKKGTQQPAEKGEFHFGHK